MFPISRDPPEGGTTTWTGLSVRWISMFPISRDPPEGGTPMKGEANMKEPVIKFPISRDPPEGGTAYNIKGMLWFREFPISRDPPEGGTQWELHVIKYERDVSNF